MNYHWYKILHYFFILGFIGAMSASFFQKEKMLITKIFYTAFSVLTLLTGIMLAVRLGAMDFQQFPIWIKIKFYLWVLLSLVFPILNKKTKLGKWLFYIQLPVLFILIYTAVFKPL